MVWVHDREVGVVKMEIGPLNPEKGCRVLDREVNTLGKFLRGRCGFRS